MVREGATVDSLLARRRIGRSEWVALAVAALAWTLGAAAWMTGSDSSPADISADISFDDRFVPVPTTDLNSDAVPRSPLQPLDRSAVSVLGSKLRDARSMLSQQLLFADWRDGAATGTLTPTPAAPPAVTLSGIPLPRARPVAADVQLASVEPPAAAPTPPPRAESPGMLQRLSNLLPGKMRLASLGPTGGLFDSAPDLAALGYDNQTAVYDITAHAVYLPNGSVLEAHSGMGDLRDDPEHVDQRMVGATPPATYELKPREKLFHGVPALRMTPVDGTSALGRVGLLTHSFMLGPDGDSNGCVSIRDYVRFRKAYDDGVFTRLIVVPSLSAVQAAQHAASSS